MKSWKVWASLILLSVLCWYMPLLGYFGRLMDTLERNLFRDGSVGLIAHDLQEDTLWFKRYFTGPPSDAEMISLWRRGYKDFEWMAKATHSTGLACARLIEWGNSKCADMAEKYDVSLYVPDWDRWVPNSVYRVSGCGFLDLSCADLKFKLRSEPQDWREYELEHVAVWEKTLVRMVETRPAGELGLNPEDYPDDPMERARHSCFLAPSLDTVSDEIFQRIKENRLRQFCVIRQLDERWFLMLTPILRNIR